MRAAIDRAPRPAMKASMSEERRKETARYGRANAAIIPLHEPRRCSSVVHAKLHSFPREGSNAERPKPCCAAGNIGVRFTRARSGALRRARSTSCGNAGKDR